MNKGKVDLTGLTDQQKQFAVDVMAMVMDKLIQDDVMLDELGQPLPVLKQADPTIQQAMTILNYD